MSFNYLGVGLDCWMMVRSETKRADIEGEINILEKIARRSKNPQKSS